MDLCAGSGPTISACSTYNCLNTPLSYNTNAQFKSWGLNCKKNGFGLFNRIWIRVEQWYCYYNYFSKQDKPY